MPVFKSTDVPKDDTLRDWWYNSLDCAVTKEIFDKLKSLPNQVESVYTFGRALQAPALAMMLRGMLIDPFYRQKNIERLEKEEAKLQGMLDQIGYAVWDLPINPRSPTQLKTLFYETLKLPTQYKFEKGVRKISTDREALEKLSTYYIAEPIINLILEIRDRSKKLGVLKTGIDPDGRMRCSYNVTGTETGRWSSSKNVWGRGTNLQNITGELRRMFIADPGYKLVYVDLEQAESRAVGFLCHELFGDDSYLDACESGDLHTLVCKLVWRNLPWTGDLKKDKEIAEQPFYRIFSYRDMSKRGGHGTNYYGKPPTMSKHLKVAKELIESFQNSYFGAFPGIRDWHKWTSAELMKSAVLTTPLGRRRIFFSRPNDDATLRQAIAYTPQSFIGDLLNYIMYLVWERFPQAQLLLQVHDCIVLQIPEDQENELVPLILETTRVPIKSSRGRTMIIPGDAKVGWNWAVYADAKDVAAGRAPSVNPDGLAKWKGKDERRRVECPEASVLDRVVY